MIRVYADMTADLFHYGHVEFLKQARALGDYLLVGVHSDDVVEANKRKPILTQEERIKSVAGCRWVDEVFPVAPWKFDPTLIEKYNIDLVVHGDDYSLEQIEYYYAAPLELGIFHAIPYTPGISTSDIIRRCQEANVIEIRHDELQIAKGTGETSFGSERTRPTGVPASETPPPSLCSGDSR